MQVLNGNGDVVQYLEKALEDAKAGTLVGVSMVRIESDNRIGWAHCWHPDVTPMFALLLAGLDCAKYDLLANGLEDYI